MPARHLNGDPPRRARGRCGIVPSLGWFAAATLAVLGAWAPAHAAEPGVAVDVRAATHAEFGRLVLEWPRAVEVTHERLDDRFVVRFDRPFDADLAIAPVRLGGYLRSVEAAPDGRAAVLHLEQGVTPTLKVHDARIVVIDLRHRTTDEMRLRTGVHQGYARIVLDWLEPIAFDTEDDEQSFRISFARPLKIDAAGLAKRLPEWLRSAAIEPRDGGSELRLRLRQDIRPLVFPVDEDRLVIDLHEPASYAAAFASLQAARTASAEHALVAPAATSAAPTPGEDAGSLVEAQRRATATAPTPRTLAAAQGVEGARAGTPTNREMAGTESETKPSGATEPADEARSEATQPLRLRFGTEVTADERALAFTWSRPIGAAVLIRAGHLWTVFGDPPGSATELPHFTPAIEGFLGPGEVIEAEGGVAVRFALRRPLGILVERSGARWRIRLMEDPVGPQPIDVVRTEDPHRLRLLVEGPFARVRARDPDVGDMLEFWPLLDAGRGLPTMRRLVDLELLATAQGIVWRPLADGLRSLADATGIDLPTPHGPVLSAGARTADGATPPSAPNSEAPPVSGSIPRPTPTDPPMSFDAEAETHRQQLTGSLDLARWGSADPGDFRTRRAQLMIRAGEQDPAVRDAARLDLARLLLSQAMAAEALAVLGVMEDGDANAGESPTRLVRQGLAGAADLLMGRLAQAEQALDHPELEDQPEIALWRAVLAAAQQDWGRAAQELMRSDRTLDGYPPRLQLKLGLPAAMIALEAGNRDLAKLVLARVGALDLHPTDRARVRFLQGLALARSGATAEAGEVWRKLERSPHPETRTMADYARLRMLLDAGEVGIEEALARFERSRPLWRGHPWEPTMLDGLADVRLRASDLPGAIRAWRELIGRAPNSPLAEDARERVRRAFVAALTTKGDDELGPIRVYALYREFPELVPDGAQGAQLRRSLARQLARLDLVAPASALLRQVMEDEPVGPDRSELGAEMADLELRLPDPEAALALLQHSTPKDDVPRQLDLRRRRLEARALTGLDRSEEALAVLADADDEASDRLRVEILWQRRDWAGLIGAIEPLVSDLETGTEAEFKGNLSREDQTLLLQLAIAHARQGDRAALDALRRQYGAALREPPVGPAFQVVTLESARAEKPDAALALAETHLGRLRDYLDHSSTF